MSDTYSRNRRWGTTQGKYVPSWYDQSQKRYISIVPAWRWRWTRSHETKISPLFDRTIERSNDRTLGGRVAEEYRLVIAAALPTTLISYCIVVVVVAIPPTKIILFLHYYYQRLYFYIFFGEMDKRGYTHPFFRQSGGW